MSDENFTGHLHPERHRTVGGRAWCDCGEWCYPREGCSCCIAWPVMTGATVMIPTDDAGMASLAVRAASVPGNPFCDDTCDDGSVHGGTCVLRAMMAIRAVVAAAGS